MNRTAALVLTGLLSGRWVLQISFIAKHLKLPNNSSCQQTCTGHMLCYRFQNLCHLVVAADQCHLI